MRRLKTKPFIVIMLGVGALVAQAEDHKFPKEAPPKNVPAQPSQQDVIQARATATVSLTPSNKKVEAAKDPTLFAGNYVVYLNKEFTLVPMSSVLRRAAKGSVLSDNYDVASKFTWVSFPSVSKKLSLTLFKVDTGAAKPMVSKADLDKLKDRGDVVVVDEKGMPVSNFGIK